MSVLPIRVFGDPVLSTLADTVTVFDGFLERLVEDMFDTMRAVGGVGLAAPQVGVGLRVFTYLVSGDLGYVVNPVLEHIGDICEVSSEGCLSVPKLGFELSRSRSVNVSGVNVSGDLFEVFGEGLLARVFQHEVDHLEGKLYISRLSGEDRVLAFRGLRTLEWDSSAISVVRDRGSNVNSSFGVV